MATLLTPDYTYTINGVPVRVKLIPDGTRWKDAAKAKAADFSAGAAYKNGGLLCGTGKPEYITIHNTDDLPSAYDDGEQYSRATLNENMGSTRIHFYSDDTGAWQNLRAGTGMFPADSVGRAEIGWHSGDGVTKTSGNYNSLAIECIMGQSPTHDAKARDNTARLAAWLLWWHGLTIDRLVTHTYWVAQAAGKKKADVDEQCTTAVFKKKWCPSYIFASTSHAVALRNWKAFKALVQKYLEEQKRLDSITPAPLPPEAKEITVGGIVTIKPGAVYGGLTGARGATVPNYITGARRYTVKKLGTNKGVPEALLAEISSWVAVASLIPE